VRGSFWFLFFYDVADAIRLESIRTVPPLRTPRFRQPVPAYVGFERPPVSESVETTDLASGERIEGTLHFYDYGVVSVKLELRFESDWRQLVERASRWIDAPEVEQQANSIVRRRLEEVRDSLLKPFGDWLSEDYYIVQIDPGQDTADELIRRHAGEIAQIVRGEARPLSREEQDEILQSRVSYYPNDLLVPGWMAAFIADTAEGSGPTIQILEYANTQLLEFRHYDQVLTRELAEVYHALDQGTSVRHRWTMARRAVRLNTIRLDLMELAERVDNSLKFLSDMFAARMYRLAAAKVGVPDYRRLVDAKLHTAGELYRFMMDQFYQGRAFLLELMVVIILIIELVFLFKGKS